MRSTIRENMTAGSADRCNGLHELRGVRASSPGIGAGVAHSNARANSHDCSMQMFKREFTN